MATNFDKSRDLKTLASNLHGEEFLKTICVSVMRRATKFFYVLFVCGHFVQYGFMCIFCLFF